MNDNNNIIPNVVNELCALQGHTGRIFSLALCKNNDGVRLAASASHDRTVIIWDIEKNIKIKTLKYSDFIWRVFFMHNSNSNNNKIYIFAFISTVDKIYVTDIETGEHIRIIDGRLLYSGLMCVPRHILEDKSSTLSSISTLISLTIFNILLLFLIFVLSSF
jgi:WD40 repeat protein